MTTIKIMFGAREPGDPGNMRTTYLTDVAQVSTYSPGQWAPHRNEVLSSFGGWNSREYAALDWEHDDAPGLVFVAVVEHVDDRQPTCIEIQDPSLFGVWLMGADGQTVDTLYRGWQG